MLLHGLSFLFECSTFSLSLMINNDLSIARRPAKPIFNVEESRSSGIGGEKAKARHCKLMMRESNWILIHEPTNRR
ncbi:hypothetical protein GOM71_20320 [Paenibacillus sp. NEAU-GSW1]|nr:hypothetical protein [Paenibacillus sp. NEAU-GSW1]